MRLLPAAAIPVGATVLIEGRPDTIVRIINGHPREGRLSWQVENREAFVNVGAADRLVVTYLPPFNVARFAKGDTKPLPRRRAV